MNVFVLVAILVVLLALMGLLGIIRAGRWKDAAIAWLFIIGVGASLASVELLSQPKPYEHEWRSGRATILQHSLLEGEAVYIWVQFDHEDFPRSYVLPWREETAQNLEKSSETIAEDGGAIVADFEEQTGRARGSPQIYPDPPPEPENKPHPNRSNNTGLYYRPPANTNPGPFN